MNKDDFNAMIVFRAADGEIYRMTREDYKAALNGANRPMTPVLYESQLSAEWEGPLMAIPVMFQALDNAYKMTDHLAEVCMAVPALADTSLVSALQTIRDNCQFACAVTVDGPEQAVKAFNADKRGPVK